MNEKPIHRLLWLKGLMPIYQKAQSTSNAAKGQKTYLYLLKGFCVDRLNHLWAGDITYHPKRRGFPYFLGIMDWYTCKVLAGQISKSLEANYSVKAKSEAIHRFSRPETIITDQGSQFTSFAGTDRLKRNGKRISMDGKGCFFNNIFIERPCRSYRYECVQLHACGNRSEAKARVTRWIEFYKSKTTPFGSLRTVFGCRLLAKQQNKSD